jgi:sugar lactone lactonase YvrE
MLIGPATVCFDAEGNLYVAEAGTQRLTTLGGMAGLPIGDLPRVGPRIRRIGKDGKVTTIAGQGTTILNDPGTDDSLITPLGMLFDREGRLVVADSGNNQVKVLPKGSF